ncbi:MAG: hypothetical protein R2867_02480 [Caldilineaceae bacterium]
MNRPKPVLTERRKHRSGKGIIMAQACIRQADLDAIQYDGTLTDLWEFHITEIVKRNWPDGGAGMLLRTLQDASDVIAYTTAYPHEVPMEIGETLLVVHVDSVAANEGLKSILLQELQR